MGESATVRAVRRETWLHLQSAPSTVLGLILFLPHSLLHSDTTLPFLSVYFDLVGHLSVRFWYHVTRDRVLLDLPSFFLFTCRSSLTYLSCHPPSRRGAKQKSSFPPSKKIILGVKILTVPGQAAQASSTRHHPLSRYSHATRRISSARVEVTTSKTTVPVLVQTLDR
jgi:hypothetical protein